MASQPLLDFLAVLDEDYVQYAGDLHPAYQSTRELAQAKLCSLEDLGLNGVVAARIQYAAICACSTSIFQLYTHMSIQS